MIKRIKIPKFHPSERGNDSQKIKEIEDYIDMLCRELEYILTQLARGD